MILEEWVDLESSHWILKNDLLKRDLGIQEAVNMLSDRTDWQTV